MLSSGSSFQKCRAPSRGHPETAPSRPSLSAKGAVSDVLLYSRVAPHSSPNNHICRYAPPDGYVPTMENPMLDSKYSDFNRLTGVNRVIVPFVACESGCVALVGRLVADGSIVRAAGGDLSGFDSDRTYPAPDVDAAGAKSLAPTQPPINPPYKQFLDMRHGVAVDGAEAPPQGTPLPEHAAAAAPLPDQAEAKADGDVALAADAEASASKNAHV